MSSERSEVEQEASTKKVRDQGRAGGLFRACMDSIKRQHSIGQGLRMAFLAAGLLTDARCYGELISQFYIACRALEERLAAADTDARCGALVEKARALGYGFTAGFEADLAHLLGSSWATQVEAWTTAPAQRYADELKNADELDLIAGVFILWGPMVIGGGAMLMPRVKKSFGKEATHLYSGVTGAGRGQRRKDFIAFFDAMLDGDDDGGAAASSSGLPTRATGGGEKRARIIERTRHFMDMNNEMMDAVKEYAWWTRYAIATCVVGMGLGAMAYFRGDSGSSEPAGAG